MTQPTGTIRKLPYTLNDTLDIEGVVGVGGVDLLSLDGWTTDDTEERIDIVLNLSLDEYVALASSLDVGRDIAYGDNSMYVWWVWVRSLLTMGICQSVIDCINDNQELRELIAVTGRGSGVDGDSDIDPVISGTNVIGDITDCDDDKLFGAITGMVDMMNATAEDLIEIWDNSVNAAARIGDMIEAIPIIGEAPFDDILQMTETFLQDLADNYDAAYTLALRDEYRCDLFCLMQPDCNFTLLDVFNYFNDRLTSGMNLTDVNSFIVLMLTQPDTGTELVDAFHAFFIASVMFGTEVAGIDQDLLVKMVSALFNDPDNDWDGLCDACHLAYEWDLTAVDAGLVAHASRASWVDGSGWGVGNNDWHIQLSLEDFTSVGIASMTLTISEGMNTGGGEEFKFRDAEWGESQNSYDVASTGQTKATSTPMNVDCTGIALGVGNVNPTDYDGFMTKLRIDLEVGESIPAEWSGGTVLGG